MTDRYHDKQRLSLQKPIRETAALVSTAECKACRSVMKSGYPIHERVELEKHRYHLMQRMPEVLMVRGRGN